MPKQSPRIEELCTLMGKMGEVGITRASLAEAMHVSKITVASWVEGARKQGHKIKTKKVRQGERGPLAIAYVLV